ncbi:MAG: hypothetical protein DMF89_08960 [Acidobacteria bacterium]|nr:MAG: hypothetical protein DMF89_08960 [Acidobacteriota bacterium]
MFEHTAARLREDVVHQWLSALSCRLSALSDQLSAISSQRSAFSDQLSAISLRRDRDDRVPEGRGHTGALSRAPRHP